jgi:hypothetical protein
MSSQLAVIVVIVTVVAIGVGMAVCFWVWSRSTRARVAAIRRERGDVLLVSAQVSFWTHRALRRISATSGTQFVRTGSFFTVVIDDAGVELVRGAGSPSPVASFSTSQIRDVAVGHSTFVYARYTVLKFGIAAGSTVYELPIRVNGPGPTSLMPASDPTAEGWAATIGASRKSP